MKLNKTTIFALLAGIFLLIPAFTFASTSGEVPAYFGIPLEFYIFALTLIGVAVLILALQKTRRKPHR